MKKRLFSVVYMFILTFFFTSVVSAVKHASKDRIRVNEEMKLQKVVLDALHIPLPPEGEAITELYRRHVRATVVQGQTVFAGYDRPGAAAAGYAFRVVGPGFWGPIEAVVAVDASATRVIGVNFYKHAETPGLGARMTERWFQEQFRGLPIDRKDKEAAFFLLVPPGTAAGESELDAITGATQTSQAIERLLNTEIDRFVRSLAGDPDGRS